MQQAILVVNAGSSSIKFSVFEIMSTLSCDCKLIYHGVLEINPEQSNLTISNFEHAKLVQQNIPSNDYTTLFNTLFEWVLSKVSLVAIGHRVVHGGTYFKCPVKVTPHIIEQMEELIPLAPLHQGHNINPIKIIAKIYPQLPQIACFDTSFHYTQNHLAKLFAIPRALTEQGIIRYGFHGLSYEYIASVITQYIGDIGRKRVIVQHLGNGASMCGIYEQKSVASSMGFTALDGLMMGTRCGTIDPGVIIYLIQEKHYSIDQVVDLLYHQSGLIGVSGGLSNDMRQLLNESNTNPHASEAIELFCYRAACEIGSLSVSLGGCDALVFTAGIGEHNPQIRQKICSYLHFQGVELNNEANSQNKNIISTHQSKITVSIIPTDEEYMIAKHVQQLMANPNINY
ncbi:MAG: acetate kinase [Pseudomonadota bacterium]|nr:acetate kinase [Pseudomonadota bacterium]